MNESSFNDAGLDRITHGTNGITLMSQDEASSLESAAASASGWQARTDIALGWIYRVFLLGILLSASILLALGGWAVVQFRSVPAAIALLEGKPLWIDPVTTDLGLVDSTNAAGYRVTIFIHNLRAQPLSVYGLDCGCWQHGCVSEGRTAFPLTVSPRSKRKIEFVTTLHGEPGERARIDTSLITSHGDSDLRIVGRFGRPKLEVSFASR